MQSLWDTNSYYLAGVGYAPVVDGQTASPSHFSTIGAHLPPGFGNYTQNGFASGLPPGSAFMAYAAVLAANGSWYNAGSAYVQLSNIPPPPPRPSPFSWLYTTFSSNGNAEIDQRDWENLQTNIAALRAYKKLPSVGFQTIDYTGDIYAWQVNDVIYACQPLMPYMTNNVMPPLMQSGGDAIGAQIDNIRISINSVP